MQNKHELGGLFLQNQYQVDGEADEVSQPSPGREGGNNYKRNFMIDLGKKIIFAHSVTLKFKKLNVK